MEKGAVEQKRRWYSGLLTWAEKRHFLPFFCLLFLSLPVLNLYSLSDSEIRSLRFVPRDDMCFVGQEVTFTLELPGIDPSILLQMAKGEPVFTFRLHFLQQER